MKNFVFVVLLSLLCSTATCQKGTTEITSKSLLSVVKYYAAKYKLRRSEIICVFHKEIKDSTIAYLSAESDSYFFYKHIPYSYAMVDSFAVCFYDGFKILTSPTNEHKKNFYTFMKDVTGSKDYENFIKGDNTHSLGGWIDRPILRLLIDGRDVYRLKSGLKPEDVPDNYYPTIRQKYFNNNSE